MLDSSTTPASDRTARWTVLGWLAALAFCIYAPWAPLEWWWLAPCSVVPLIMLAAVTGWRTRTLALLVACASAPAWLALEWWIHQVSIAGLPVLVLYMSFWTMAEFIVLRWLMQRRPEWPLAWSAVVAIVSVEWLRGVAVLDGYPWFSHGMPLVHWPLAAQCADISSVSVLSAVVAIVSASIVLCLRGKWIRGISTIACVMVCVLGYGLWRLDHAAPAAGEATARVLVVQTNLATSNKLAWSPSDQVRDVDRWLTMTVESLQSGGACDLAVWPETMVPGMGLEPEVTENMAEGGFYPGLHYIRVLRLLASASDTPLLVGSHATESLSVAEGRWKYAHLYNSAYLITPSGQLTRYDKIFLTPFGETMPLISNWEWLEGQLLALGASGMTFDLDAGVSTGSLEVRPGLRVAAPICFEDTVPRVVRSLVWSRGERQADILLNLSNDGWFGASDAGRRHHLTMARGRAIENRTPLIRCANTGISCAVDAAGRMIWEAEPQVEGAHRIEVGLCQSSSLFGRYGDLLSMLAITMLIFGLVPLHTRCCWSRSAVAGLIAAAALGCAGLLAACESQATLPAVDGRPWSTKSASITDPKASTSGGPARLAASPATPSFPLTLDLGATQNATDLLLQASLSPSWELRARAVEGLSKSPAVLGSVAERLVGDAHPAVRFATALVIGNERLCTVAPMTRPLLVDRVAAVRAAALFALARCDESVDLTPLATMLMASEERDASTAADLLGRLGNPSALPLLQRAARTGNRQFTPERESIYLLQVAAAMVELGDETQLDPLRAALFQPEAKAELIGLACQLVVQVGDRGSLGYLHRVMGAEGAQARPLELRLVAAWGFLSLGGQNVEGVEYLGLMAAKEPDPRLRAQAAVTLGLLGTPTARDAVSQLLADKDPNVQVAAAAAILKGPIRQQ